MRCIITNSQIVNRGVCASIHQLIYWCGKFAPPLTSYLILQESGVCETVSFLEQNRKMEYVGTNRAKTEIRLRWSRYNLIHSTSYIYWTERNHWLSTSVTINHVISIQSVSQSIILHYLPLARRKAAENNKHRWMTNCSIPSFSTASTVTPRIIPSK